MSEEKNELEELDELEELEELEEAAPATGAEDRPRSAAPAGPRELEKAPLMLRKAALVLVVASLFPWVSTSGWDLNTLIAKVVVLLGGYLAFNSVKLGAGEDVPGVFRAISGGQAKVLNIIGLVLMLAGVVVPFVDPGAVEPLRRAMELIFLAIGLIVVCQITTYEKGGKFNPTLGLFIPFAALAGLGRLVTLAGSFDVWALIGGLLATGAGIVGGYTLFLAMKEAKEHGQAKRRAQMEARQAARKASRRKA